jgi:hypothetical protein
VTTEFVTMKTNIRCFHLLIIVALAIIVVILSALVITTKNMLIGGKIVKNAGEFLKLKCIFIKVLINIILRSWLTHPSTDLLVAKSVSV